LVISDDLARVVDAEGSSSDRPEGIVDRQVFAAGGRTHGFLYSSAAGWTPTREELWNAVEAKNKRADSQLAREIEISLPGG
jgi:hypothetical protein